MGLRGELLKRTVLAVQDCPGPYLPSINLVSRSPSLIGWAFMLQKATQLCVINQAGVTLQGGSLDIESIVQHL